MPGKMLGVRESQPISNDSRNKFNDNLIFCTTERATPEPKLVRSRDERRCGGGAKRINVGPIMGATRSQRNSMVFKQKQDVFHAFL